MDLIKKVDTDGDRERDFYIEMEYPVTIAGVTSKEWVFYIDTYIVGKCEVIPEKDRNQSSQGKLMLGPVEDEQEALCRFIANVEEVKIPMSWRIHEESLEEALEEFTENLKGMACES